MKRLILILALAAAGWYGYGIYQRGELPFASGAAQAGVQKCTTPDGSVIYGEIPAGTLCQEKRPLAGATTRLPRENFSGGRASLVRAEEDAPSAGDGFRCDGRVYCSQMTSCAEATFFLRNCPDVKMDGNHDGVPCEKQWCR